MSAASWLGIAGVVLSLLGSLAIARGLFISKKDAIALSVSRFAGDTDEENLKLPATRDRLSQRNWAALGAALLLIGSALQIGAIVVAS